MYIYIHIYICIYIYIYIQLELTARDKITPFVWSVGSLVVVAGLAARVGLKGGQSPPMGSKNFNPQAKGKKHTSPSGVHLLLAMPSSF